MAKWIRLAPFLPGLLLQVKLHFEKGGGDEQTEEGK